MAYKIIADNCTACAACESECPNDAIKDKGMAFAIDPGKCTECHGLSDEPRCVAACPSDACVKA